METTTLNDSPLFRLDIQEGIATITLDNAPVNALSGRLMRDLLQTLKLLATREDVKVIVFDSANPEFFVAHVDINILAEQDILDELTKAAPEGLNLFQAFGEAIRHQPQVTVVKLKGFARGGGAEFVAAADMSFASLKKGKLAQCEALMGIIPGGGATQYLSSRMTRGRALEVILGADLFDAPTAERYGWINRAIADEEIDEFVENLARNIAALPTGVIATIKKVVPPENDKTDFKRESDGWEGLVFAPEASRLFEGAMRNGAQTVEGELKLEELLRKLK